MKIARTSKNNIAFAVLCDGMGGLKNGELASALVVNAFSKWFETEFPLMMKNKLDLSVIKKRWNDIAAEQSEKIMSYGKGQGISLGTTLTAILIVDEEYIYVQVGDSRIYKINSSIQQITKDQTLIEHEIEQQRLTVDEARRDSRKNILLQCIGASNVVVPDIQMGTLQEGDVFMLCSDGFRHEISSDEMYGVLAPSVLTSEKVMKKSLVDLIELNKTRKEKDNITALIIKAIH